MSNTGNLYCSGLYEFDSSPKLAANLGFVAALAVYDLVTSFIDEELVHIKWPNDVLIQGAKCAGILLEHAAFEDRSAIIVGIGVNLASHPDKTDYPATHIMEHISDRVLESAEPMVPTPQTSLAVLTSRYDHWRRTMKANGFERIRTAWLERSLSLPRTIVVKLHNETFKGEAVDMAHDGALVVRLEDGQERHVHAGDVFFDSI